MGIDPPRNPQNSPKEGGGRGKGLITFSSFFFPISSGAVNAGVVLHGLRGPWGSYKEVGFLYGGYSLFLFFFFTGVFGSFYHILGVLLAGILLFFVWKDLLMYYPVLCFGFYIFFFPFFSSLSMLFVLFSLVSACMYVCLLSFSYNKSLLSLRHKR